MCLACNSPIHCLAQVMEGLNRLKEVLRIHLKANVRGTAREEDHVPPCPIEVHDRNTSPTPLI